MGVRMSNYNPDRWVIVRFTTNGTAIYKVLGGWSGGYLDSDNWRLSSGLESIEEDGDYYLMHNYSGSIYKCHKNSEGFSRISEETYDSWQEQIKDMKDLAIDTVTVEKFNESKV